jgi:hypothetical protein
MIDKDFQTNDGYCVRTLRNNALESFRNFSHDTNHICGENIAHLKVIILSLDGLDALWIMRFYRLKESRSWKILC